MTAAAVSTGPLYRRQSSGRRTGEAREGLEVEGEASACSLEVRLTGASHRLGAVRTFAVRRCASNRS
eukprot:1186298-Prorocentrum_minimum.AAC.3